ncbi:MAG TPA: multiheme c-type cytochrome [Bryobacteraceae bacterium]|nr:multiheme c-type cytochrome [Bryobacteraceae bacterium]
MLLALSAVRASDYAGAEACGKCHPAQFAAQSGTAHAAALTRSKPPQPGDWAFGAGAQAITFVKRLEDGRYLELGESWYRKLKSYARTPGHTGPEGVRYRVFDPEAKILRCFGCHSTGPLSLAKDESIVPRELGVRCEVCHGPGAAHAADPAREHVKNPGKLDAAELNNFCGACHRTPAAPGETPDLRAPWNARHQPLLLAASACFKASRGKLSCLTCHSPHAPLETRPARYDAACLKCHPAPKHSKPIAALACVDCHMPPVRPDANLAFANHRIAIYAAADPLTPVKGVR